MDNLIERNKVDLVTYHKELIDLVMIETHVFPDQYKLDEATEPTEHYLEELPREELIHCLERNHDQLNGIDYLVRDTLSAEPIRLKAGDRILTDPKEINDTLADMTRHEITKED